MGLYLQKTNIIRDYLVGVLPGGEGGLLHLVCIVTDRWMDGLGDDDPKRQLPCKNARKRCAPPRRCRAARCQERAMPILEPSVPPPPHVLDLTWADV